MTRRPLRILYVEDEPLQQRLLAHALGNIPEYDCKVSFETTETGGVASFQRSPPDAVFVDYQLAEGDGLELIRRLRRIDRLVPIIAISGVASSEIAAELIVSGADDYLSKSGMDTKALALSLGTALSRADGLRNQLSNADDSAPRAEVADLGRWVVSIGPALLLSRLDRCEAAVRALPVRASELVDWFETAATGLAVEGLGVNTARLTLRPFLLDLLARLEGDLRPEPDAIQRRPSK